MCNRNVGCFGRDINFSHAFGNRDITIAENKYPIFLKKKKLFACLSSIIFNQLQKIGDDELAFCQTSERGCAVDIRGACNVTLVETCNE